MNNILLYFANKDCNKIHIINNYYDIDSYITKNNICIDDELMFRLKIWFKEYNNLWGSTCGQFCHYIHSGIYKSMKDEINMQADNIQYSDLYKLPINSILCIYDNDNDNDIEDYHVFIKLDKDLYISKIGNLTVCITNFITLLDLYQLNNLCHVTLIS